MMIVYLFIYMVKDYGFFLDFWYFLLFFVKFRFVEDPDSEHNGEKVV